MRLSFLTLLISACCQAQQPEVNVNFSDYFDPAVNASIKATARRLFYEKKISATVDRIDFKMNVRVPLVIDESHKADEMQLSITGQKGEKPVLFLSASHHDKSWIFAKTLAVRFGTNVIRIQDAKPRQDVTSGGVYEGLIWIADEKSVQNIIKAVVAGSPMTCRLEGKDGDRAVIVDEQTRDNFRNILAVYFAMGGVPLNL